MKTLLLTSPHMKGTQVKEAQLLLKSNVFKQDYLQGEIDSEFGPESMRACKRAKYWLGYADKNQTGTYGKFLHAQLTGHRQLSKAQKERRVARLKKAKETPLRMKALAEARKDLGMKENPANSNICEISKWWKMIGPWCNMAVSQWYIMAGSKAFKRSVNWAYCPFLLSAAIRGEKGLAITRDPEPGDIVLFDWDDDKIADHVGIMTSKVNDAGNFKTIEGNTAIGNDSNGGECMERDRNVSQVVTIRGRLAFIHVGR